MPTNVFPISDFSGTRDRKKTADFPTDWFLSGRAPSPRDAAEEPLFPLRANADMPPAAIVFPRLPEE